MTRPPTSLVPIWSLGLAAALAGGGVVWSQSGSAGDPERTEGANAPVSFPALPRWEQGELIRDGEPVRLRYRAGSSQPIVVAAEHVTRSGGATWQTRVRLEGTVERIARSRSGSSEIVHRYRYRHARMRLLRDGRPVGGSAMRAAEREVEGTSHRHRIDPLGSPIDRSAPSKVDRTNALVHELIGAAIRLTTPRLRTDAILPGETWSYRLPFRRLPPRDEGLERGSVRVQLELKGIAARDGGRWAVLTTAWRLETRGTPPPRRTTVERRGHGEGRFLFDLEAGAVEAGWLEMNYRSETSALVGGEQRHEVRIYVGATDDERLP